jgi:tetratricopeptide (TPR) repeat protein
MKKHFLKHLVLITTLAVFVESVFALTKEELQNRKATLTSEGTHRRLTRAHDLMGKGKLDDAIEVLTRLDSSTAARPHENAQVLQTLGFAYAQKEKYDLAISHFQRALDLKVLPYSPTLSTIYTMAQVMVATERYDQALKNINLWLSLADEPSADVYVLKATIFAQQNKNKEALELVTKAIAMSKEPKESWLAFAVAMNYQLENYKESARLLEILANNYPEKKKYWKQLAGVYLNLEKNPKALATMELAHKLNYLDKGSEILNLVSLLIYGGIPLKGAAILEQALADGKVEKSQKHYEILGDAWAQAEEMDKALVAYAQSAKMAQDGRIFAKQGRIYLEQERWDKAAEYISQGLAKGGIKNVQHVYMALGVAQFNLQKFEDARASFESAKKASDKVASAAEQWISYVNTEDQRVNPEKYAKKPSDEEGEDEQEELETRSL